MKRPCLIVAGLLFGALSLSSVRPAHACSRCMHHSPMRALRMIELYPGVFEGDVVSVERVRRRPQGMPWIRATVRVHHSLRGPAPGATVFVYRLIPNSCPSVRLHEGASYTFFLPPNRYPYRDRFPEPDSRDAYVLPGCDPSCRIDE